MLRFANGARGALWASQVAPGNENNLRLRVYGSRAGSSGARSSRTSCTGRRSASRRRRSRAAPARPMPRRRACRRIPSGHPEGYLEAFATLYGEIAQAIRAARPGGAKADEAVQFPDRRRRPSGRRIHRGGGRVVGAGRALGQLSA